MCHVPENGLAGRTVRPRSDIHGILIIALCHYLGGNTGQTSLLCGTRRLAVTGSFLIVALRAAFRATLRSLCSTTSHDFY